MIELQHSYLCAEERAARERFYRNIIWVVDGTRLQRDLPRFIKGAIDLHPVGKSVYAHPFSHELFPKCWLGCSAPVFFDFGASQDDAARVVHRRLWCLLPQIDDGAIVLPITREVFIRIARENAMALLLLRLRKRLAQHLAAQRVRERQDHLSTLATMIRHWRRGPPIRSKQRRF
ncbi:MAG: hypothetical protein ABW199_00375 [Caulobacterales bacterium]